MAGMKIKIWMLVMVSVVVLNGCKKSSDNNDAGIVYKNVSYGQDAKQNMDVYLPAVRDTLNTKALLLIHGGAWMSGDKADFDSTVMYLRNELPDYAIFNINYRLAQLPNVNVWPAQLNDVNAAFDFIRLKSTEYGFNKQKIVIGGASAGAHLALLKAYKYNTSNSIKAVVDLFGPTEMKELYNSNSAYQFMLNAFMAGTPLSNPSAYNNASPLYAVNNNVPPTIIFHGGMDMTVPVKQSDSLYNRLVNANVATEYKIYPNEAHGWYGANLTDTYTKMIAFIKQKVQ